jgi:hypothetical protein
MFSHNNLKILDIQRSEIRGDSGYFIGNGITLGRIISRSKKAPYDLRLRHIHALHNRQQ